MTIRAGFAKLVGMLAGSERCKLCGEANMSIVRQDACLVTMARCFVGKENRTENHRKKNTDTFGRMVETARK